MLDAVNFWFGYVHCRTGSLENDFGEHAIFWQVHCRTGSLEIVGHAWFIYFIVHCRTGSLEMELILDF